MLKKLFGATTEEQWAYLRYRVPVTLVIVGLVLLPWPVELTGIIAVAAYYWGWCGIKRWLGLASLISLFGGYCNLVLGVVILVGLLLLGYLVGLVVFLLAFFLWAMLMANRNRQHTE